MLSEPTYWVTGVCISGGCKWGRAREVRKGRERVRETETEMPVTCPSVKCGNYPGNVNTPLPLLNQARHWSSQGTVWDCVCVCVCMIVREKERERERTSTCLPHSPRELLKKPLDPTLGRLTEKFPQIFFFFSFSHQLSPHTSDVKIYILIILT